MGRLLASTVEPRDGDKGTVTWILVRSLRFLLERHTMSRGLLLALLGLFLTFGPAADGVGGTITYDLQNFPALQNGYTLSGSITTDGTIGTLSNSDVVAWSFSVTGPQAYTLTSQDPACFAYLNGVIATATSLIIPVPVPTPGLVGNFLTLISEGTDFGGSPGLRYIRDGGTTGSPPEDQYSMALGSPIPFQPNYAWLTTALRPPGLNLGSVGISAQGGGSSWTIGTLAVPEPSTLTLALLGIACLAVAQTTMRSRRAASKLRVPGSAMPGSAIPLQQ